MNGWSVFLRQTTVLCLLLAVALAVVLLTVKHQVQSLEEELGQLRRDVVVERQSYRVLQAEFALLTQPERLRHLSDRYLGLVPVEPRQLGDFASLDQPPTVLPAARFARKPADVRGVHVASRGQN
jgi:hypothetical protein